MAAPMELSCWGGDWGLPSLHPESLTVMVTAGGRHPPREEGKGGEEGRDGARGLVCRRHG